MPSPRKRRLPTAIFVSLAALHSLHAQSSTREYWPEADIFVQDGERLRFILRPEFTLAPETGSDKASFTVFVELALRPVLRTELRNRDDVFRRRFLTFRGGYRYITGLGGARVNPEHRAILEVNSRFALPARVILSDRNRGEFRFIDRHPFSMRYRNRIGLERDMAIGAIKITPEAFNEYFYDTRYGTLANVRWSAGLQVPAGRYVVLEPYLAWQINKQSTLRHIRALAFKLNLYL